MRRPWVLQPCLPDPDPVPGLGPGALGSNSHTLISCSDSSKPEDLWRFRARLPWKFPAPILTGAAAYRLSVLASQHRNAAGNGHIQPREEW